MLKGGDLRECASRRRASWGPPGGGLLDHLPDLPHGAFLSDDDFEVFVSAFEKSGFRRPLNWYRNIDRNWEECAGLPMQVSQPALMITAELDIVLRPEMADGCRCGCPTCARPYLIEGSGHWTQQEKPEAVNRAMLEFLADLRK